MEHEMQALNGGNEAAGAEGLPPAARPAQADALEESVETVKKLEGRAARQIRLGRWQKASETAKQGLAHADCDDNMRHRFEAYKAKAERKLQEDRPGCVVWSEDTCCGRPVLMLNPDGPNCDSNADGKCKCSLQRVPVYIFNRASWDVIALLALIYVAVTGPIHAGFDTAQRSSFGFSPRWDTAVDIIFVIDILLNFFTTFRQPDGKLARYFWVVTAEASGEQQIEGAEEVGRTDESVVQEEREDRGCCAKQCGCCDKFCHSVFADYLFGWFAFDFIASVSVALSDGGSNGVLVRILRLFRLAKLLRFTRIFKKLLSALSCIDEKLVNNQASLDKILDCIKALGGTFLFAHMLACLWHRAGEGGFPFAMHDEYTLSWTRKLCWETPAYDAGSAWELHQDQSWAERVDCGSLVDAPLRERYVNSLYWAMTTLSTVGYGDVTPETEAEKVVAMLTETIGTVMFCYLAGNIIAFVSTKRSSDVLREEKLEVVNEYLRVRAVDRDLKLEIRRHFEQHYEHRTVMNEADLLETMPAGLKHKLVDCVYGDYVRNLEFLVGLDSDSEEELDAEENEDTIEDGGDTMGKQSESEAKKRWSKAVEAHTRELPLGGSSPNLRRLLRDVWRLEWNLKAEKHALCLALQPLPPFAKYENIYKQGDHSTEMYLIWKGQVRATRRSQSDDMETKEEPVTFHRQQSFGLYEMLGIHRSDVGREYTADADQTGCTVMYITQDAFIKVCEQYPTLRAAVSVYYDDVKQNRFSSMSNERFVRRTRAERITKLQEQLESQHHLPWTTPRLSDNESTDIIDVREKLDKLTKLVQELHKA